MFPRNGLKIPKKTVAGAISLLLLLPNSVGYGAEPTKEELLNSLRILTPKGSEVNVTYPLTKPLIPNTVNTENRPVTWGDFLNFIVNKFNFDAEFLLNYSNARKELIMTKDEIQENYKLLIEAAKGVKMNYSSSYRLAGAIYALNPYSNFLFQQDLLTLSQKEFMLNEKGDMIERFKAKILKIEGSVVELQRVGNQNYVLTEKYILDTQRPWTLGSKIYEVSTIGNSITSVEPVHDIRRAIVQNRDGISFVDNYSLGKTAVAKPGDYIEYFEEHAKIHVIENYGSFEGSYVVKSTESSTVDTYEGTTLRRLTILDKEGTEITPRNLKRGDLVSRFGDFLIVNGNETPSTLRYSNKTVYLDNVGFDSSDILIQDGSTIKKFRHYDYIDYVNKVNVIWDALGNPKVIKVPQVEYVVDVRDVTRDGIVKGVYSGGEFEAELDKGIRASKIREGRVYNFVVVDGFIYEYEELDYTDDEVDTLYDSYFYMYRKQYVDSNTLVIVSEYDSKGKETTREIKYSQLLKEYESKIKNGYMDITVYYLERGEVLLMKVEYHPMEGMSDDKYLKKTPLNLYKVTSINTNNVSTISLNDGSNTVTFTVENKNRLQDIKVGDYVEAYFSSRGNLSSIYPFEYTHQNITTAGLVGYLKTFETTTNVQNVMSGSSEEAILRATYTFYRKSGDTAVEVKPNELLAIGHQYIILVDGNPTKVIVLGGAK